MKATLKVERTLPFFDSAAEIGLESFQARVTDPSGVVVADLNMVQVVEAPNLYLSEPYKPLVSGQHKITYMYGDPLAVIAYTTLDVGPSPVSDIPIGEPSDIVLDDNIVGGPNKSVTARLFNSSGESISSTSLAEFTGSSAIDTIAINDGDSLTFQITPDPNTVGAQDVTFLCAPAVAEGGGAGNFAGSSAGDTASYSIDDGPLRTLDLSSAGNTEASYLALLNAQLKGGYAESAGNGVIRLITDSQGTDSSIELSNLGQSFAANTGLAEGTYDSDPSLSNVSDSDAVTFSELKMLIETSIMDSVQGDRIAVSLEEGTDYLVLSATSGAGGSTSTIDLVSGTTSVISALGLSSLGSQGGNDPSVGSDGVSVQAPYSSAVGGYAVNNLLFNSPQEVFVVWFDGPTQAYMTNYLVAPVSGKEVIRVYVGEKNADHPQGNPHIAATVVVSKPNGVQVAQGVTDVVGSLRLELIPGDYVFTVVKKDTVFSSNNFKIEVLNTNILDEDGWLYKPSNNTAPQAVQLMTDKFAPTVTEPVEPASMCTLFATLYLMDGTPLRHAAVHVLLLDRPQIYDGTAVIDTQKLYKTDSNGRVEFSLIQGLQVEVNIAPLSVRRRITVPSSSGPVNLMTLLSSADDPFDVIIPNIPAAPKRTL